jgi:hypothetical protein
LRLIPKLEKHLFPASRFYVIGNGHPGSQQPAIALVGLFFVTFGKTGAGVIVQGNREAQFDQLIQGQIQFVKKAFFEIRQYQLRLERQPDVREAGFGQRFQQRPVRPPRPRLIEPAREIEALLQAGYYGCRRSVDRLCGAVGGSRRCGASRRPRDRQQAENKCQHALHLRRPDRLNEMAGTTYMPLPNVLFQRRIQP